MAAVPSSGAELAATSVTSVTPSVVITSTSASSATHTPKRLEEDGTAETVAGRTRSQTKKSVSLDLAFEKLTLESTPTTVEAPNGYPTPTRPNSAKIRSHRLMFQSE